MCASAWAGLPSGASSARRCKAVFTVLPHFVLRYRTMRPDVARDALLATHGGLSLEWCATICHISPMALYRVICAFGQHSLVAVLTRCGLRLPAYILADEKHSRCLTDKVYLPTIVSGRVIWHLGYSDSKSAAAFTQSYGVFQQAALEQEPSYRVKGALTDGFDSTVSSMRTLFPGARLGFCLRHALNKLPGKLVGVSAPVRQGLRSQVPRPAAPVSTAQKPAGGGIGPAPTPLCRSHRHDGGRSAWRARAALVPGQESGVVCGARRPADAGDEHRVGSSAQRHRPQALRHEGLPPSRWESSGVSHRPGASVQLDPLSAPGPATRASVGWKWKAGAYPPQNGSRRKAPCCLSAVGFLPALPAPDKHAFRASGGPTPADLFIFALILHLSVTDSLLLSRWSFGARNV